MDTHLRKTLFVLFFISGFCSLLYQTVWIRLAFASFGIITPVMSVIISVYMLGLSLGSWLGGRYIEPLSRRWRRSPAVFYGAAEAVIGVGAFLVPGLFLLGQSLLINSGEANSFSYLFLSAVLITLAILPFCVFMGATFPFMMAYTRRVDAAQTKNFSFLYLANVIGAMTGVLLTALVLIEDFGFSRTLWIAGGFNFLIALLAFSLKTPAEAPASSEASVPAVPAIAADPARKRFVNVVLFTTGFTSIGMEVVWTRAFTPVLGTQVYAFAGLLFVYLLATWVGSLAYRRGLAAGRVVSLPALLMTGAIASLLPIVLNDPHITQTIPALRQLHLPVLAVLASIFPLCAVLGYLTPYLIDDVSGGDPDQAGSSYAINIVGCILGPLFVSYALLPVAGVKASLVLLALPYLAFFFLRAKSLPARLSWSGGIASAVLLPVSLLWSTVYEVPPQARGKYLIKRDHTATVVSYGEGMHKRLLVNGVGITHLTPITKFMAHLPSALLPEPPESGLVICFGMGTTYRSLLSWDMRTTAVELVPGVRDVFGYYFDDAEVWAKHPKGKIVIDDGRRFLMRTGETFDVVTLDPPPPIEAAGSSLLYSEEFYSLVKRRLAPDGILQQWIPFAPGTGTDIETLQAVARSLVDSFPYVRAFVSVEGWGVHFLASRSPITVPPPDILAARFPAAAEKDLLEWAPGSDLQTYLGAVVGSEVPVDMFLSASASVRVTDNQPYNEYYLMRRAVGGIMNDSRPGTEN